jgi:hypothetical protein
MQKAKFFQPSANSVYFYVGSTTEVNIGLFQGEKALQRCYHGNCFPDEKSAEKAARVFRQALRP